MTELVYVKTNDLSFAPSEDSDQPVHPPCQIRVFAMHLMASKGSYFSSFLQ